MKMDGGLREEIERDNGPYQTCLVDTSRRRAKQMHTGVRYFVLQAGAIIECLFPRD
jgi:hypothetical protein